MPGLQGFPCASWRDYAHGRSAFDQEYFLALDLKAGPGVYGYLDTALMGIFIAGVVLVVFDAVRRWIAVMNGAPAPQEAFGPPLTAAGEVKMGCC